jgi:vacuolar-type H+-ATPase subunit E/Vma4
VSPLNAEKATVALQPVGRSLLDCARTDAEREIAEAQREAERIVAAARAEAARLAEKAHVAGQEAAKTVSAQRRAVVQRELRGAVLAARYDMYQRWCRRGTEAVLRLRDDPAYPRWAAALRAVAQETLGADAQLREQPTGGVVAEAGQRCIDLSLAGIAARVLDDTLDDTTAQPDEPWA